MWVTPLFRCNRLSVERLHFCFLSLKTRYLWFIVIYCHQTVVNLLTYSYTPEFWSSVELNHRQITHSTYSTHNFFWIISNCFIILLSLLRVLPFLIFIFNNSHRVCQLTATSSTFYHICASCSSFHSSIFGLLGFNVSNFCRSGLFILFSYSFMPPLPSSTSTFYK